MSVTRVWNETNVPTQFEAGIETIQAGSCECIHIFTQPSGELESGKQLEFSCQRDCGRVIRAKVK